METVASKTSVLSDAGYTYNFDRMLYINRNAKKAFSVEFLQDASEEQIQECIRERTDGAEWKFYFVAEPSESVKHQLESIIG